MSGVYLSLNSSREGFLPLPYTIALKVFQRANPLLLSICDIDASLREIVNG